MGSRERKIILIIALIVAAAVIAAAVFFLPSVFYDRQTKKDGSLTYTILRLF